MSVETMAVVLHHSRAKGTAKLILLGIANHDGDGGAWPTLTTLARYANVNVRNAREALRKLEASGELITMTQAGGLMSHPDETRPNLYRVNVRCPVDCDGTSQHRTRQSMRTYPLTLDIGMDDPSRTGPPSGRRVTHRQSHPQPVDTVPSIPQTDETPPVAGDRGLRMLATGDPRMPATAEPSTEPIGNPTQSVVTESDQPVGPVEPVDKPVPCPPDLARTVRDQLTRERTPA